MEKTVFTPGFIAIMSVIFLLRSSPIGLDDIRNGMTPEFLWFFIPAITAQFISYSLKLLRMVVCPVIQKKMEEHAIERKVMFVCNCFEIFAIHKMIVLVFINGPFWVRFIAGWFMIGIVAFMSACILIMHFWYGKNILKIE